MVTHGKFYSWKVFHLEDISENLPSYVTIKLAE